MRMIIVKKGLEDLTLWTTEPGGKVRIYKRNGSEIPKNWLGGIDAETAKQLPDAHPVKIKAQACSTGSGLHHEWRLVNGNRAILGCLFNDCVYAILDRGEFRIVSRNSTKTSRK
ncbi:hypothetical protein [Marinobacter sp. NFXS9]|uniref:hypothetical protein n=1 Tax=Marinobacter sp. NFXS9 TaxID=2818433 RepID=UPI0032DED320